MGNKDDEQHVTIEDIIPSELSGVLKNNELVVWCWACAKVLYDTLSLNPITERVARNTVAGHQGSYTAEHPVTVWANKGQKDELDN